MPDHIICRKAPKGVTLPCPNCGEQRASFALRLACADGEDCFACLECDAEFSFGHMAHVVNAWAKALQRVGAMMDDLNADLEGAEEAGYGDAVVKTP